MERKMYMRHRQMTVCVYTHTHTHTSNLYRPLRKRGGVDGRRIRTIWGRRRGNAENSIWNCKPRQWNCKPYAIRVQENTSCIFDSKRRRNILSQLSKLLFFKFNKRRLHLLGFNEFFHNVLDCNRRVATREAVSLNG